MTPTTMPSQPSINTEVPFVTKFGQELYNLLISWGLIPKYVNDWVRAFEYINRQLEFYNRTVFGVPEKKYCYVVLNDKKSATIVVCDHKIKVTKNHLKIDGVIIDDLVRFRMSVIDIISAMSQNFYATPNLIFPDNMMPTRSEDYSLDKKIEDIERQFT